MTQEQGESGEQSTFYLPDRITQLTSHILYTIFHSMLYIFPAMQNQLAEMLSECSSAVQCSYQLLLCWTLELEYFLVPARHEITTTTSDTFLLSPSQHGKTIIDGGDGGDFERHNSL